jgi:intracellular multiplication protein IcmJ
MIRAARVLLLSVKRKTWRKDAQSTESSDEAYRAKRPSILERDRNTCLWCGFKSSKSEVHHEDDDHTNNSDANLGTACPLCHGVSHIGQVGISGHGRLAHIPGLSQLDLNHLQRTIAMMLHLGDREEKQEAQQVLMLLASKGNSTKEAWGTSQPHHFGTALLHAEPGIFERRDEFFRDLALIYRPERFAGFVHTWAEEAYRALPPKTWNLIHDRYSRRASES